MDLQITKLEIIEMLLQTEKESVLAEIRLILEKEQELFKLSEEDYKILDVRRKRHMDGTSESFTWEQIKKQAREPRR